MNSEYLTEGPEATLALGQELAAELGPGKVMALAGELGAGKTVLAKGLACGLGVADPDLVTSPTFTLVNQYQGHTGLIYHIDLYRLHSADEAGEIGLDEMLASGASLIIEWPEIITDRLPGDTVRFHLSAQGRSTRRIQIAS